MFKFRTFKSLMLAAVFVLLASSLFAADGDMAGTVVFAESGFPSADSAGASALQIGAALVWKHCG